MDDLQKERERRDIERMVKSQAGTGGNAMDVDSVSKAAKRTRISLVSSSVHKHNTHFQANTRE